MGIIEISKKLWDRIVQALNISGYPEGKRVETIEEAKELPSPLPRVNKNEDFLDALDELFEKYYLNSIMVGVTNTNSMDGWIDYGHQVILIPFKNDEEKSKIQVGDIIWFKRMSDGNENVLHRVIEKNDGWVVTRGDNLVVSDGPTVYSNIKGYLAAIIY